MLRSLPHHPYSAENVTHAFNAVWALAEDPENNRTFLAQGHGLVDEVVKALARFHEQEECAEQGCAAIWCLARNAETRVLLGATLGAGAAVARCIDSHPDNADCWYCHFHPFQRQ